MVVLVVQENETTNNHSNTIYNRMAKETEVKEEVPDTTDKCSSCGKTIYKGELCSCQKKEVPSWMPDIKKEIPLDERHYH